MCERIKKMFRLPSFPKDQFGLLNKIGEFIEEKSDEKFYKKKDICVLGFLVNSEDPEMPKNKNSVLIEK